MTEKSSGDVFDWCRGLRDLYIVLNDEGNGLIKQILDRDAMSHYDGVGDLVTMLECFEDDVRRVWNLVEFHDELVDKSDDDWLFFLTDDPNALDLRFRDRAWLQCLRDRINSQLMLDELNGDSDE